MWPFQRKTEAPADSGPRPVPAPVMRRDWTGLPPIQRLIGEHPLTAPSDRFSDDLATHHDPSVSSEPMGHQVSADAPAGIVLALARPTMRNDGPAMISRPRVQRRAQSAVEESGEWDGDEAAPPATRPSPLPAVTPPTVARELPAVAPAPVMQRLTALPPDVEPLPVKGTARRPRMEPSLDFPAMSRVEALDAPVAPPRRTLGQARRLGLGAPINRVPDRTVQRAAADMTEMPLAASRPSPDIVEGESALAEPSVGAPARPTSTERLELPLAPRQAAATPHHDPPPQGGSETSVEPPVQRAIEISAEPPTHDMAKTFGEVPTPGPTEISARPVSAMPLVQPSVQREPPQVAIESFDETALPLAVPQRAPHPDPSPQGVETSAQQAPAPTRVQRVLEAPTLPSPAGGGGEWWASPARGGGKLWASPTRGEGEWWASPVREKGVVMAPLAGARPLRPTTLQRSLEPSAVDRTAQRTESPQRLAAPAGAERDNVGLPSSPDMPEGVPTGSPFSEELASAAPPSQDGPTTLGRTLAVGRRFQVQTQSERPASRAAELPLATAQRAAADSSPERSEPGGESTPEVVQRGWFNSLSSEVSSLSSRAPLPTEAGSAAGTVGSALGSMFGGHKEPETDMDELAGKLYDKIRNRLKSELLVDRERAGFLTDLR